MSAISAQAHSDDEGSAAFHRAREASDVDPPHLEDFAWGAFMGIEEASAHGWVARSLEDSIARGELVAGSRGWRTRQRATAAKALEQRHPEQVGHTWREVVLEERIKRWAGARGKELAFLRSQIAESIREPVTPPDEIEVSVEALRWLLGAIGGGVPLTVNGNLARAFVVSAAEERGWRYFSERPRQEADVPELTTLHALARRMHAVRRQGRTLRLTTAGAAMARDCRRTWDGLVDTLAQAPSAEWACVEALALLLLATPSPVRDDWLFDSIASVLGDEGYRTMPNQVPPSSLDARGLLADLWLPLEVLRLIERSGTWNASEVTLTAAGEATLRAGLRKRATAPWSLPGY